MKLDQALDVGHTVDAARGGGQSRLRLEHRACNRRAAWKYRTGKKKSIVKKVATDDRDAQRQRDKAQQEATRRQQLDRRIILPSQREIR